MPPTRRKPSTTASQRAQQTLAFGPTPTNKITKAPLSSSSAAAGTKKKHPPTETDTVRLQKSAVAVADISTPSPPAAPPSETADDDDDEYPRPPERQLEEQSSPRKSALAIRGQQGATAAGAAAIKVKDGRSEAEEKAGKVSEAQVNRYWKSKEDERIAARVHQGGLSVDEKILRHFDLSSQFGPCIGIPRMKRWKRAENLGLKPPVEVLAVLLKEEKGGNVKAERAFMEGLLTSRLAVNE